VAACDENEKISEGINEMVLVSNERFLRKVRKKMTGNF
jgi:hypothetical protein